MSVDYTAFDNAAPALSNPILLHDKEQERGSTRTGGLLHANDGFLYALNLTITAIADALVYLKRNEALHKWAKTLGRKHRVAVMTGTTTQSAI